MKFFKFTHGKDYVFTRPGLIECTLEDIPHFRDAANPVSINLKEVNKLLKLKVPLTERMIKNGLKKTGVSFVNSCTDFMVHNGVLFGKSVNGFKFLVTSGVSDHDIDEIYTQFDAVARKYVIQVKWLAKRIKKLEELKNA